MVDEKPVRLFNNEKYRRVKSSSANSHLGKSETDSSVSQNSNGRVEL